MSVWPPPFELRKSLRAKHISLKISARKGLEVIIPEHRKRYNLTVLFDKHRAWIEQNLLRRQVDVPALPQMIDLMAIEQQWQVNYQPTERVSVSIKANSANLILSGKVADETLCKSALRCWLQKIARQHLTPMLEQISLEIGLAYTASSIRLQTSRWGSCSGKKQISLNAKLLLLPSHLVRYVIIHELCHTVHLNHSDYFWELVSEFDPCYQIHRQELKSLGHLLPSWIEA